MGKWREDTNLAVYKASLGLLHTIATEGSLSPQLSWEGKEILVLYNSACSRLDHSGSCNDDVLNPFYYES